MNTRCLSSLFACASLLLALLIPPAHAAAAAGKSFGSVAVPAGMSALDVKEVLVISLVQRNWTVTEKTDSRVIGNLKHRGTDATITLTYSASSVEIHCEGWKIDKAGVRSKPDIPDGWAENIKKDVGKRLTIASARK
ncbi:MAG: hypothetical protein V4773_26145 [Verrucomicrobiota bacterium]